MGKAAERPCCTALLRCGYCVINYCAGCTWKLTGYHSAHHVKGTVYMLSSVGQLVQWVVFHGMT